MWYVATPFEGNKARLSTTYLPVQGWVIFWNEVSKKSAEHFDKLVE